MGFCQFTCLATLDKSHNLSANHSLKYPKILFNKHLWNIPCEPGTVMRLLGLRSQIKATNPYPQEACSLGKETDTVQCVT